MHPYCCLHSIRRNLCKIFLAFYVLQKVIFVTKLTTLRSLIRSKSSFDGVSVGLWRASIGRFHASYKAYYESKKKLSPQFSTFYASLQEYLVNIANQCLNSKYYFFGFYILVFINFILLCGDIEKNLGPKTKPNDNLSVCYWNVNSIPSHNFQKIAVLESFVAMHKFDIICISETFLNNTYEDNDLNLNGYSLLRADAKK